MSRALRDGARRARGRCMACGAARTRRAKRRDRGSCRGARVCVTTHATTVEVQTRERRRARVRWHTEESGIDRHPQAGGRRVYRREPVYRKSEHAEGAAPPRLQSSSTQARANCFCCFDFVVFPYGLLPSSGSRRSPAKHLIMSGKGAKGLLGKGAKGTMGDKKGDKKKPISRSARAGLQFPVGRIHRLLKVRQQRTASVARASR